MVNSTDIHPYLDYLIRRLEETLEEKYKGDFSFQISGNHRLIAAHNYRPDITWTKEK